MTEEKKEIKEVEKKSQITTSKKSGSVIPKILLLVIVALVGYLIYTKTQVPQKSEQAEPETAADVDMTQAAQDAADPAKWSYAFGRIMGRDISSALMTFSEGPTVDKKAVLNAVEDALNEVEGTMSDVELQAIIQERIKLEQEAIKVRGEENKESGVAFLAEYGSGEGVSDAGNGSLYRVLAEGAGEVVGENVATVVYTGKHIDGEVFDSTEKNGGVPAQFVKEGVIPGLGDVLAQMKQGDKWEIVIPSENAYGPNGIPGVILPHEVLVFEIEIAGVSPRPEPVAQPVVEGAPTAEVVPGS